MVGQRAVAFELLDSQGKVHRLEDSRERDGRGRWLVLLFHRHLG